MRIKIAKARDNKVSPQARQRDRKHIARIRDSRDLTRVESNAFFKNNGVGDGLNPAIGVYNCKYILLKVIYIIMAQTEYL